MTSEERLTRIERMIANNATQIANNAEQITELHLAIDKTNASVWRTHKDVIKLEVKIDQLSSVIAHLVGKDPLDFGRRIPEDPA